MGPGGWVGVIKQAGERAARGGGFCCSRTLGGWLGVPDVRTNDKRLDTTQVACWCAQLRPRSLGGGSGKGPWALRQIRSSAESGVAEDILRFAD